jgi:hypothetical protein
VTEHPVLYEMTIDFVKDKVCVKFTGESVKFIALNDEQPVRPRHLRIVNEIHNLMREFIRDNNR